jgi:hypothetical protein
LEVIRQEQEKQAGEFQQAIAARDATFRAQLDTATQRLESAQAHMLSRSTMRVRVNGVPTVKRPRRSSNTISYREITQNYACRSTCKRVNCKIAAPRWQRRLSTPHGRLQKTKRW